MKYIISIVFLLFCISTTGCRTTETQAMVDRWFNAKQGKTTVNVAGKWQSDGWGLIRFKQKGNVVSGIMGAYDVQGRLNNRTLYLTLWQANSMHKSGKMYYTAKMELENNNKTLFGKYYYTTKQQQGWAIELKRP